jgi:hypothetical protein
MGRHGKSRVVRVPAPANDNGPALTRAGRLFVRLLCAAAIIAAVAALLLGQI